MVPVGDKHEVEINGKRLILTNPGVRAVLKAQEECLQPNGQISILRYVEMICSRWVEPRISLDDFADEDEVVEFLRIWNEFRRPKTVGQIRADPPTCRVGQTSTIYLDDDRKIVVTNPGLRWVLEAQEACTLPNGQFSWLRYAERVLRDCTLGQPKLDEIFLHEDEVIEFLRLFRLLRSGPKGEGAVGGGTGEGA